MRLLCVVCLSASFLGVSFSWCFYPSCCNLMAVIILSQAFPLFCLANSLSFFPLPGPSRPTWERFVIPHCVLNGTEAALRLYSESGSLSFDVFYSGSARLAPSYPTFLLFTLVIFFFFSFLYAKSLQLLPFSFFQLRALFPLLFMIPFC